MHRLNSPRAGLAMGSTAYLIWGLIPLYLKMLQPLAPASVLAVRILWSLLFVGIIAVLFGRGRSIVAILRQPKLVAVMMASSLLIASNWLIYIMAVDAEHVMQASIGYFINPLLNVLLGVVVLREKLGRAEIVAIALAAAGVVALTIHQHALPTTALVLALTFGLYGLVRKMAPVEAIDGLLIETALLSPIALGWLLSQHISLPVPGPSLPLVAASGIVTASPLLLFTAAAKRIRYADLALLQYLSPTLQLLLAVAVFGEAVLPIHLITFALIWIGIAIYVAAGLRRARTTPLPE